MHGVDLKRLNVKGARLELLGTRLFVDGKEQKPDGRRLSGMRDVLLDWHGNRMRGDTETYYMYRKAGTGKDRRFEDSGIRYDVTVIPKLDLGKELNKTLGHYHSMAEKGLSYPEIYEVIEGEALYILQRDMGDGNYDVMIVSAKAGDNILVPPNYGHITVNTGKGMLVMANLVSDSFVPDYRSIVARRGGSLYVLKGGSIVLNRKYKKLNVRYVKGTEARFLPGKASLYDQFLDNPKKFRFLQKPHLLSGK